MRFRIAVELCAVISTLTADDPGPAAARDEFRFLPYHVLDKEREVIKAMADVQGATAAENDNPRLSWIRLRRPLRFSLLLPARLFAPSAVTMFYNMNKVVANADEASAISATAHVMVGGSACAAS